MQERELRNAIGMYCGDKDRDLSDTGKVATHLPWFTCVTKLALYNHCFFSLYATRPGNHAVVETTYCLLQSYYIGIFNHETVTVVANKLIRCVYEGHCSLDCEFIFAAQFPCDLPEHMNNLYLAWSVHIYLTYNYNTAMYICVYMQTYLDISLQHLSCGHLSSWQRSSVNIQWGYPHCRCSPHYSDRSDQYQYQSEHMRRQLHLLACNMWT